MNLNTTSLRKTRAALLSARRAVNGVMATQKLPKRATEELEAVVQNITWTLEATEPKSEKA